MSILYVFILSSYVRSLFILNSDISDSVYLKWNEMKTSIAPNSSDGRAQRRNPSLLNSKEESREISMVVIRDAEELGRKSQIEEMRFKIYSVIYIVIWVIVIYELLNVYIYGNVSNSDLWTSKCVCWSYLVSQSAHSYCGYVDIYWNSFSYINNVLWIRGCTCRNQHLSPPF